MNAIPVLWENLPEYIPNSNDLLVYKLETLPNGKTTKVPYDHRTGRKSNDPKLGASLSEIQTALSNGGGYSGAGYFIKPPIMVIDIDNCVDENQNVAPYAADIVRELNSYTELSIGRRGLHIFVRGTKPGTACRKGIEIYDHSRFVTLSGYHVEGTPKEIREVDITSVYDRMLRGDFVDVQKTSETVAATSTPPSTDSAQPKKTVHLILNGNSTTSTSAVLMDGQITQDKNPFTVTDEHGNRVEADSQSECDLSLATHLAFTCKGDINEMDAQFRKSALMRNKFNRQDYRDSTLKLGLASYKKAEETRSAAQVTSAYPPEILSSDSDLFPESQYRMTCEEIAAQEDAEYPVYKLHESAGPDFDDADLYGPIGAVARRICQFSEAHAPTVYLNLIVSFGSMFGRGPYFNIDATKHYTNENIANVAPTSEGRKGTCSDAAEFFLRTISPAFMDRNNVSGFASSQAVIAQIKDSSTYQIRDRKTSMFKTVLVPGVEDKRLCIRENELSGLFKLLADSKNRAGELFRNAWDGKPLSNKVSGKTDEGEHRSLVCREPHVSIIGSTTPSLAKSTLPVGVDKSGDGNRFIWCFTKRTQLCPHGGPPIDWLSERIEYAGVTVLLLVYLQQMLNEAYEPRLIPLTRAASKFCTHLYLRLENDRRIDFLGGMTRRAAAHIRRLAMILCLIDRENAVDVKHLQAAEAIWDFSQESARFIFKGYSLDQEKILRAASEKNDGLTLTDVHELFKRHKSAEWRRAQLRGLVEGGYLTVVNNVFKFKRW